MARLRTVEAHYEAEGDRPNLALTQVTSWTALGVGVQSRHKVAYTVQASGTGSGDTFELKSARGYNFVTPFGRLSGPESKAATVRGPAAGSMDLQPAIEHCSEQFGVSPAHEGASSARVGAAGGALAGGGSVAALLRAHRRPPGPVAPPVWLQVLPRLLRGSALAAGTLLGASTFAVAARSAQLRASLDFLDLADSLQDTQDVVRSVASERQRLPADEALKWHVQSVLAPQLGGAAKALHEHAKAYLQARGVALEDGTLEGEWAPMTRRAEFEQGPPDVQWSLRLNSSSMADDEDDDVG